MAGERLERVKERSRAVIRREGERRPPAAVAPVEPRVGATETKRVNASGWSPTLASMIVRPLILAARSLAIATIVGSASFATIVAASPVVGAATASASGSDAISFRH